MLNFFTNFFKSAYDLGFKSLAWLFVYLTPLHVNLVTIYLLLFCDLVSGLTKAHKKGEPITANKLSMTVTKFIFYSIAIVIAFQVDIALFSSTALVLTHIVGYYITLIEFKSNIENISEITNTDLWSLIKDKVNELFNSKIKEIGKDKKDETN